ncbi:MAG: DUF6391 domain-containing protein [Anaerolineae bacterium]
MNKSLLEMPFVLNTRRNHALEHATLHVLADKYPNKPMAGHSNPTGFFILGNLPTEEVRDAVSQAHARLRAGESSLAIHAGCGTNIATSTLVAASFAWFAMRGARSTFGRLLRLPLAIAFAFVGSVLSRPLGPVIQSKITTDANVEDLRVLDVRPAMSGRMQAHQVRTTSR